VLRELRAGFASWAARLGQDHLIDMSLLRSLGESALTSEREIELQTNGLPNTFVPARNDRGTADGPRQGRHLGAGRRARGCRAGDTGGRAQAQLLPRRSQHAYPWGYGCGGCPACTLRPRGHARWQDSLHA
jgi:7-cyano-7-deazaguanine synthase in queuosine biosynthesis